MNTLQMIKDYLEECESRNELVDPEILLEQIEAWQSEDD